MSGGDQVRRIADVKAPPIAPKAPLLLAPQNTSDLRRTALAASSAVMIAGIVLFGRSATVVAAISIASCVSLQWILWHYTGRRSLESVLQACLTGVLIAITLPPFVPWYVPVLAALVAIVVGKAIFVRARRCMWTPALLGRLAVALIIPAGIINPQTWPAPSETTEAAWATFDIGHKQEPLPRTVLSGLSCAENTPYSALLQRSDESAPAGTIALTALPDPGAMLTGRRAGAIGETCAVMILAACALLVYRNCVRWQLLATMAVAAISVAAIAPINLLGPGESVRTVWLPIWCEGLDVGIIYCAYQILADEIPLAIFIVAIGLSARPIDPRAQIAFGAAIGAVAMLMQLYLPVPVPAYLAVLVIGIFSPQFDALLARRPFGLSRRKSVAKRPTTEL